MISNAVSEEQSVRVRYSAASKEREAALCCPVDYRQDLLEMIPQEIIDRDYGCGDPSPFVKDGDTVLDLGAGGGKLCYIAAQLVGRDGRVIGVDCNPDMLNLARRHQSEMADKLGYDVVDFRCGMIQDLQLDLEKLATRVTESQLGGVELLLKQRHLEDELRADPMIASDSVDCVVSNCVLNLVRPVDRRSLFAELYRVLKNGGRAAISDIVCDEDVPAHLQANSQLWSGCISGAWREDEFVAEFEQAGFHGMQIAKRQAEPWQTVEGIEFRSITVVAWKGKQGPCLERNQAVVYRGPFSKVEDDDGHVFDRGVRTAVCDKTFNLLQQDPYVEQFLPIEPRIEVPLESAKPIDCLRSRVREPRETKGSQYDLTLLSEGDCCGPDSDCC
jgi:arsenite methyltransferase